MFRALLICCLAASTQAFVQAPARLGAAKVALSKAALSRASAGPSMSLAPGALAAASVADGAFVSTLSTAMGLEVKGGAFLAIILGLLVPVIFLVILYIKVRAFLWVFVFALDVFVCFCFCAHACRAAPRAGGGGGAGAAPGGEVGRWRAAGCRPSAEGAAAAKCELRCAGRGCQ